MKSERQEIIIKILENNQIETQEELISKLKEYGVDATQATISRDIRALKLTKVLSDKGKYIYIVPQTRSDDGHYVYNKALTASILDVRCSLNTVVVHTLPGMANAVATGIDAMKNKEILGCVAGDDTIIIITSSEEVSLELTHDFKKM